MHMYTHDRLWPQMSDLAAEIESHCTILAPYSGTSHLLWARVYKCMNVCMYVLYVLYIGGDPFDEACSCPWADLHDKLNEESVVYPLPMVRKVFINAHFHI